MVLIITISFDKLLLTMKSTFVLYVRPRLSLTCPLVLYAEKNLKVEVGPTSKETRTSEY